MNVEFVGRVRLDLEIAAPCADGAFVVLQHPGCRPSPWFPAVLLQNDARDGNSTLLYGWSSETQGAWTRATAVPTEGLTFYECVQRDWQPDGGLGRGYEYLPSCEAVPCVTGCTVSAASAGCGDRLSLGDVCAVECARDGWVNLTCDALAWPEDRSVECLAKVVYCDEVADPNAVDCVDRGTTSTLVPQADRRFAGCAELRPLAPLVVGMPDTQMVSGAYYFEVEVWQTGQEAIGVGFIDGAWSGGQENLWSSTLGISRGQAGAAIRFIAEDTAEIRFSWEGVWEAGQTLQFSRYLAPVALADRSSWRIPQDAWRFLAPSIFYAPLTQRPFPALCNFPLDFELVTPPVCPVLESVSSPEECADAGFHTGVLGAVTQGSFPGWPANCFFCPECDDGDLYWNNASELETANSTIRQAPGAAALCRQPRGSEAQVETAIIYPEFRMAASWACDAGYRQIFNASLCGSAAAALDLGFAVQEVSLEPTEAFGRDT
ncbi:unnamed protein product [Effrenium voratum]|nr:unnamed protein product [Effrenium voratum]